MKTEDIESIIDEINKLTGDNDHSGAIVIASKLADKLSGNPETTRTKVLIHLREIHYLLKAIPPAIQAMREECRESIQQELKHGGAWGVNI